ncbi:RN115-like protein [Mya arenaria]|uniref:RN115-like protein n=1 Tax=Mya arenaria TaxID=6604 RepID=A0ABY7E028_MYAAR|nr:RN115-like protein [Mya arenaria]
MPSCSDIELFKETLKDVCALFNFYSRIGNIENRRSGDITGTWAVVAIWGVPAGAPASCIEYFSERLDDGIGHAGGGFGMPGIPINIMPIHGNPEDYAWGAGGLDAIITQLLNQLEGSGAPPAGQERIDALPSVKVTQTQVDNTAIPDYTAWH